MSWSVSGGPVPKAGLLRAIVEAVEAQKLPPAAVRQSEILGQSAIRMANLVPEESVYFNLGGHVDTGGTSPDSLNVGVSGARA